MKQSRKSGVHSFNLVFIYFNFFWIVIDDIQAVTPREEGIRFLFVVLTNLNIVSGRVHFFK